MKFKHAIIAATFLFMVGCETTGNTTRSASTSSSTEPGTSNATSSSGISTSGNTNPATTSTNTRGTLTEGATAGSSTASGTSSSTNNAGTNNSSTNNPSASNANTNPQAGAMPPATDASMGSMNSTSQNTSGAFSVPASHQGAFSTRYPNASNMQWSRYNSTDMPIDWDLTDWSKLDKDDYVVKYNIGNDPYYAWYDSEGTWVGSSMAMKDYSNLPAAVNKVLTSSYAGYKVSSANMEYWKDRSAYEIELRSSTDKVKLLVDANGNIIKQKKNPF